MANSIDSANKRGKLSPRREPYWQRLSSGAFIGYRVSGINEGTWIARFREEEIGDDGKKKVKQKYQALKELEEFDVEKYDEAVAVAMKWFEQRGQGVKSKERTVAEACKTYVAHLKTDKGAASSKDAEGRFKRLVYDKAIGKILLSKLKTTDVRKWRDDQLATDDDDDDEDLRKSKDSANRNLASLKAALNLALKDRLVATDAGWKTITSFRGVSRRREYMLTQTERTALLEACPADLKLLVMGLLLTAARSGELAKATVANFDKQQGTLVLCGKIGRRIATLSTTARTFFAEQCKGKLPTAFIFTNEFGKPWNKDDWKKPFKKAVKKAKLPNSIVTYHLRHAAISEMILGGMQTSLIAMLAGTSTAMIDKHYGHLQHEQTRRMLDTVAIL